MKTKRWLVLVLMASMCLSAASEDKIVAYVGKRPVLDSEVKRKAAEDAVEYRDALTSLITERLLVAEADELKIKVPRNELLDETERVRRNFPDDASFRKELEKAQISYSGFQKAIEDRLKAKKLITEKIVRQITVSPADVAVAYAAEKQNAGDEYRLRGKDFSDRDSAETFRRNWQPSGEAQMEEIGWAKKSELLPSVLEAVSGLKPGEITQPVLVVTKWHVFLLAEMRKAAASDEEMLAKANNKVFQRLYREKITAYLTELQKKIPVKTVND